MESIIKYGNKRFIKHISSENINKAITNLASKINSEYTDRHILFIGILNGCAPFMMKLLQEINVDYEYDFIKVASYEEMKQNKIKLFLDIKYDFKGKNIIVIEDIVDSGNTLKYIKNKFLLRKPESIKVATLLCKTKNINLCDWHCFKLEKNKFVIGYGLDINNLFRNLNSIYIENDEKEQ